MPGGPDEPGLVLRGVARQAEVGFLSLFEHYRCTEAREGRGQRAVYNPPQHDGLKVGIVRVLKHSKRYLKVLRAF